MLSERILDFDDYWQDFRELSRKVHQPVLFYYGETDWAVGPDHYRGVQFPNMILWGSKVGHMPILEADLVKALVRYKTTSFP